MQRTANPAHQKQRQTVISYAQNYEDVMLQRCFAETATGFYVDVGASSPVADSVTFHFYRKGWRGVNIEPLTDRYRELVRCRPRDHNLNVAVGRESGQAMLNVFEGTGGLSTLRADIAEDMRRHAGVARQIEIEVRPLSEICTACGVPERYAFLKVDVEGLEADVLAGADFERFRPSVVLVEATYPMSQRENHQEWEGLLLENGYASVYFDGLNRYYVDERGADLRPCFRTPPNVFDGLARHAERGLAFEDRKHPAHTFAQALARRVLASVSVETDESLLRLMTWDIAPSALAEPVTRERLEEAYRRVLGREVGPAGREHYLRSARERGLSLAEVYRALVQSDEFAQLRALAMPR
ncbi:FkbM family methyltransferase [Stappia taiwanensis]|uniref:FkbM family methyltransferase n=1 Tax=Stappia taiwanensis TaxID=992267 RepID=A0A838XUZ1_9HYPH|nr:FkbM family methyltransferase [Stappia taiwanensis]MBA4610884.1 FkbM family methyltransferase [Stappia taiwanensis]GGE95115.1 hypothetical protein GCM10007285_23460 [Stappia taiwanensis]